MLHRLPSFVFKLDIFVYFANGSILNMEVENPEELIQVLLNNPASRSALSSLIEQTVKKNHVSTLIKLH